MRKKGADLMDNSIFRVLILVSPGFESVAWVIYTPCHNYASVNQYDCTEIGVSEIPVVVNGYAT